MSYILNLQFGKKGGRFQYNIEFLDAKKTFEITCLSNYAVTIYDRFVDFFSVFMVS